MKWKRGQTLTRCRCGLCGVGWGKAIDSKRKTLSLLYLCLLLRLLLWLGFPWSPIVPFFSSSLSLSLSLSHKKRSQWQKRCTAIRPLDIFLFLLINTDNYASLKLTSKDFLFYFILQNVKLQFNPCGLNHYYKSVQKVLMLHLYP